MILCVQSTIPISIPYNPITIVYFHIYLEINSPQHKSSLGSQPLGQNILRWGSAVQRQIHISLGMLGMIETV